MSVILPFILLYMKLAISFFRIKQKTLSIMIQPFLRSDITKIVLFVQYYAL